MNGDEPQPTAVGAAFETPPAELDDLPVAQTEWRRLAPMLRACRQITEADRSALLALCIEWARYLEARPNAFPRVITLRTGYQSANPWLTIQTKALAACVKLWAELGLTPSSRSRVKTDTSGTATDPFAEFDQPASGDGAAN